jgi:hypothetical protein
LRHGSFIIRLPGNREEDTARRAIRRDKDDKRASSGDAVVAGEREIE